MLAEIWHYHQQVTYLYTRNDRECDKKAMTTKTPTVILNVAKNPFNENDPLG
jgi:hypothetical protein